MFRGFWNFAMVGCLSETPTSFIFILSRVSRYYSQGLTQKHPCSLHLKTNPGWQRISELRVDGTDGALELPGGLPLRTQYDDRGAQQGSDDKELTEV